MKKERIIVKTILQNHNITIESLYKLKDTLFHSNVLVDRKILSE